MLLGFKLYFKGLLIAEKIGVYSDNLYVDLFSYLFFTISNLKTMLGTHKLVIYFYLIFRLSVFIFPKIKRETIFLYSKID